MEKPKLPEHERRNSGNLVCRLPRQAERCGRRSRRVRRKSARTTSCSTGPDCCGWMIVVRSKDAGAIYKQWIDPTDAWQSTVGRLLKKILQMIYATRPV